MKLFASKSLVLALIVFLQLFPTAVFSATPEVQTAVAPWQVVAEGFRFAVAAGSQCEHSGDRVAVRTGVLMLEADKLTYVATPLATALVKAHAVVYVKVNAGNEHVFVLLGPVKLTIGKHCVVLNSGEEVILADHGENVLQFADQDDIGRRRIRVTRLADQLSFALTEFSLIQALERESLLYSLVHSSQDHDKSTRNRLIKTAAVLSIVTGRHGQYSTGVH